MLLRNPTTGIVCLLCARRERPKGSNAANEHDEVPSPHRSHLPGEKKNLPQPWWQRGALCITAKSDRRGPKWVKRVGSAISACPLHPQTPDVWLRRSEVTLRANRVILQCRKTTSLFASATMKDVTDLPIEA